MGLYDTVAGAADHLAGSTDEAFARSFDNQQGGGMYDGLAETTDHLAGTTDEAFARSFDNQQGGGLWDGFKDGLGDLAMERPASHEGTDSWDLPGPNFDETVGIEGYRPGGANPNAEPQDRPGWTRYVQAALVLAVVWVVGQLFTVNLGDSDE
jgi:hypothetical protein